MYLKTAKTKKRLRSSKEDLTFLNAYPNNTTTEGLQELGEET